MTPDQLPIHELKTALLDGLARHRRVLVQAPTGSGKSTQIPQMLLDAGTLGDGQVVILQPRRLATRMLAARVASERKSRLGDEVGYQIRFDNVTSLATRIRFVTEGILLRQMLEDPNLRKVRAILFDEFHERHLHGDITLARALQIQESTRPDLLLGVMSATLAAESLANYLSPCTTLSSQGRTFAVTTEYLAKRHDPDQLPIWELATQEWERLVATHPEGDVLIFMPGAYEIHRTLDAIRQLRAARDFILLPLHGELPPTEQDAAVARYDQRKVIVSTNVAETSLTIDGVRLVIDSGFARMARYDPHRGINTLLLEKISRTSAEQRTGRAGRTAPGHCLRLWTEREHAERAAQELPEVKRLDLAEVVLTLKAAGIHDVKNFRWLEAPEPRSLERAETLLADLGALDSRSQAITGIGRRMLSFPVHPRYSRMLLAAGERKCVRPIALIAAITQGRSLWLRSEGKAMDEAREDLFGTETESDFFLLMRAWRYADQNRYDVSKCRRLGIHASSARQVKPLFDHFMRIAKEQGLPVDESPISNEAVQRCLLTGFSDHLAMRLDSGSLRCALVHGRTGTLARDSGIRESPLLVAGEVREVQQGRDRDLNVLLTLATAVKPEWLRDMFPDDINDASETVFDPTSRRVVVLVQKRFRDLVLESKRSETPSRDEAARLLAREVVAGRLVLKQWDNAVEQWIIRVNRLAEWCPEFGLPTIGDEERHLMLEQICLGAMGYKEIKEKEVWPVVRSFPPGNLQPLIEQHAPERIGLPGGRKARIVYEAKGDPVIAATIQDLYGVEDLRIAMGRAPLVIHVLAPNRRPIQVTQNLEKFWREDYPKIKKELQRKYPRHTWR